MASPPPSDADIISGCPQNLDPPGCNSDATVTVDFGVPITEKRRRKRVVKLFFPPTVESRLRWCDGRADINPRILPFLLLPPCQTAAEPITSRCHCHAITDGMQCKEATTTHPSSERTSERVIRFHGRFAPERERRKSDATDVRACGENHERDERNHSRDIHCWGHPDMMSASKGEGGHGKADVAREVA